MPNIKLLENHLVGFCNIIGADEVVVFEKCMFLLFINVYEATFLVISHATTKEQADIHRFEKISNIIKQFKLSCIKAQTHFQCMEVRNANFTAFIDVFTSNSYIMVVQSDPGVSIF